MYPGGSIYECDLSVHDSHRLKAQSYFHATYPSRSIWKSGLLVHNSHRLKAQSYLHATYSGGSICVSGLSVYTFTACSHRAITMLLIIVEVPVKVACLSMTVTDYRHRAITMQFIVLQSQTNSTTQYSFRSSVWSCCCSRARASPLWQ